MNDLIAETEELPPRTEAQEAIVVDLRAALLAAKRGRYVELQGLLDGCQGAVKALLKQAKADSKGAA